MFRPLMIILASIIFNPNLPKKMCNFSKINFWIHNKSNFLTKILLLGKVNSNSFSKHNRCKI